MKNVLDTWILSIAASVNWRKQQSRVTFLNQQAVFQSEMETRKFAQEITKKEDHITKIGIKLDI